ncbi:hypothetical protein MKW94_011763 [Papaver nudicaule]|uniref:Uncharacterized protein n=1 Tax=Papaver nudicaule TaxID=74823 RepID=A0AA41V303_PAPNU|nr:hypothetical protein [Papaver nudicaule]
MALPVYYQGDPPPPCPESIVYFAGLGFQFGAVCGSVFHFLKGSYKSPKGERFIGGAQAVRLNVPRVASGFAAWGATITAFEYVSANVRHKDDPWNLIISASATAGLFDIRKGFRKASRSALIIGAWWACAEGFGLWLNKKLYKNPSVKRWLDANSDQST